MVVMRNSLISYYSMNTCDRSRFLDFTQKVRERLMITKKRQLIAIPKLFTRSPIFPPKTFAEYKLWPSLLFLTRSQTWQNMQHCSMSKLVKTQNITNNIMT